MRPPYLTRSSDVSTHVDHNVRMFGWVHARRDHGKITFIDLRDRDGLTQVVFADPELSREAEKLRPEFVVEILGTVQKRPKGMQNPKIASGTVEIAATSVKILAESETPPFPLDTDGSDIDEETRLKYRYLDLRRPRMQRNLIVRSKSAQFVRKFLSDREFIEIETPYITKGTPEGAREFVIPSRHQHGKFYTLPQSPQQFKQLLMVAGFEKYFQLARVFRDEDPRADRAYGEATQIDIEMSFTTQDEILALVEEMFVGLVKEVLPGKNISKRPFPRIPYAEAIKKYGSDKPDLRKNKKDQNEMAFAFIIDWPLFEWNKEEKRWDPQHHIFTAPKEQDITLLDKDPGKAHSYQHDLVLNGFEIGGGSIRITDPQVQQKVFELVGIKREEAKRQFGHLLEAFTYGVPPHGGIAIGFDRMFIPLLGERNLREVMAFPKTGDGRDLMVGAPDDIPPDQLKELGIDIRKK